MSKRRWTGRIYLGRDASGRQLMKWVGRFETKRERDRAVAEARLKMEKGGVFELPTCDAYVERYLAECERTHKASSTATQRQRLARFKRDFAGRSLDIPRSEARDWINGEGRWATNGPIKPSVVPAVVSLYNHAIDEDDLPLDRNPFRKLSRRTKGRADQPPPTSEEFDALLSACSALKEYAPMMRAFLRFATFTLMRPSELYALEWGDIDFEAMRITKARRLYRGRLAEPKTGVKTIGLTPPARDAILGLSRESHLVFRSKQGKRLSQSVMHGYWKQVLASAGLDFDLYHATKHYGVHYMWTKLKLSDRAIAAQAGWSAETVRQMLAVYGHGEVDALEEVDEAFRSAKVFPFRKVEGGTQS